MNFPNIELKSCLLVTADDCRCTILDASQSESATVSLSVAENIRLIDCTNDETFIGQRMEHVKWRNYRCGVEEGQG